MRSLLALALLPLASVSAIRPADKGATTSYATIHNYAPDDVLDGNDGMPPSALRPFTYGRPVVHVSAEGEMLEEHNAALTYLDGRYYMYAWAWACGKFVFFPSGASGPVYPPDDYGGTCGIKTWSSGDLTRWEYESILLIGDGRSATKPHVHYSAALAKYVMLFSAGDGYNLLPTGGVQYATADSPAGPWSEPGVVAGDHLAHDFHTAEDPATGEIWLASNPFSGLYDPNVEGLPTWDLWVQKLTPDLTAVVNGTATRIMHEVDFEALGFAAREGRFYITGGPTCGNCQAEITYIMADNSPSGQWTKPVTIAADGCIGQNKGMATLPAPDGGTVILSAIWGYRMGPQALISEGTVIHGDNSQAISSTYWIVQEFDAANGTMLPMTCAAETRVPLIPQIHPAPAPIPQPKFQPDCRVRANSSVTQRFAAPWEMSSVALPVFQRTDDLGPMAQAGPVMNGPLRIEIGFADGATVVKSFAASNVSWAPENIDLGMEGGCARERRIEHVTLSTNATNGCYGTLVVPKVLRADGGDLYFARDTEGTISSAPRAELYMHRR